MALKSPFEPGSGQDYFEEAKQLSLNAFMQTALNAKPTSRVQGRHVHYSFCPSCGASTPQSTKLEVTDDRLYHCFACADGGTIIDAAAITWGCEPLEAAKRLVGAIVSPNQRSKPLPAVAPEIPDEHAELRRAAQRQVFPKIGVSSLIFAHRQKPEPDVLKYLTDDRGLSLPVIREAWCRQLVGFLPSDPHKCTELLSREIGQDLLVESGLWKPDKRMPGIVGRPLVFFLPGLNSAEFRLARPEREGERKGLRYGPGNTPWFWRGTSGKTAVVEGMFDILSMVDAGWPGHILGYPGCGIWSIQHFNMFEQVHGRQKFHICFDGDEAGQRNARKLAEAMSDKGIDGEIIAVPDGMDINKMLIARRQLVPSRDNRHAA